MLRKYLTKNKIILTVLCLAISLFLAHFSIAQDTAPKPKPKMGFNPFQMDPRAKEMSYHFKDTNKDLKYGLFVSSKVSKNKKAPLIVTLHGLGVGFQIMLSKQAVDLAEEGGYILVGPMGYNERGWYGMPFRRPEGKTPPKRAQTGNNAAPKPKGSMFSNPNDPPNLQELSEKDVMNVLDIVRREYNVDENRIYLMGHSMGGAGTLYLGTKYPSTWAALAPIAPAAFGIEPDRLEKIKNMPVLFVHGGADELVPVDISRRWAQKAKELGMTYEFNEMEGLGHGPIIMASLPSVYEFFSNHSKSK